MDDDQVKEGSTSSRRKELIAKISAAKRSVSKGDKKAKKQANKLIEELQKELADLYVTEDKKVDEVPPTIPPRKSLAARRREKKELTERAEREAFLQTLPEMEDLGKKETQKLEEIISPLGLEIYQIPPDGNCLFNSISDQLSVVEPSCIKDCKELRKMAAEEMSDNADKYIPFISTEDGNLMSNDQFVEYCEKVKNSFQWGTHLEIEALSRCLKRNISVVQAQSGVLEFGNKSCNEPTGDNLCISYHKHLYGLGEHFNSLRRSPKNELAPVPSTKD